MVSRFRRWLEAESAATGFPLGALLATTLAVHVWVTFLSPNPWHPDEHFQILEFAWARAGLSPFADLPWEWEARIRPALQPTLAMAVLGALRAVGVDSPWAWALLLRLGTLAVAFVVLLRVVAHASPGLAAPGRRALWATALLVWFAPFFLGRFTSENLGGLALAAALPLLDRAAPGARAGTAAGALLGLAFLFRYQMALAVLPVLAWVALQRSPAGTREWRRAAAMALAALAVAAAGLLLDAWFYGAWTLTPWNYFRVNLVEGVAAGFGTDPWPYYLTTVPLYMAPPLGAALVLLVLGGAASRPRSPWSWALGAFLLGHSAVAHKETRFLLPLVYLLPVLVAWGVEAATAWADAGASGSVGRGSVGRGIDAPARNWRAGLLRVGAWVVVLQNGILLALAATPSIHRGKDFDAHAMRYLWDAAEAHPGDTVWVLDQGGAPYSYHDLPIHVYRHPRVRVLEHAPGAPVPGQVPAGTPPARLLLSVRGDAPPRVEGAPDPERVYTAEPGYRVMARALGVEDAGWLARLTEVNLWAPPDEARRLYRVRRAGGA